MAWNNLSILKKLSFHFKEKLILKDFVYNYLPHGLHVLHVFLARSLLLLSESTQIHPTQVFFLTSFSFFDVQLSPNFHRLVILFLWRETSSENTGLWHLPNVSSAFKQYRLQRVSVWFQYHCDTIYDKQYLIWGNISLRVLWP